MNYKHILLSLCVGVALTTACTDTWDNHYSDNLDGSVPDKSLWELIKADKELEQFARVIEATQFDRDLNSGQMLTIWAAPITKDEADQWIAKYNADKEAGIRDEDNTTIVQFIKNHVCLFNRSVSTLTEADTVKMMNGKYKTLSYTSLDDKTLVQKNVLATNGVFYKINKPLPFFSNVYEEINNNEKLSQFSKFLKSYDEYKLNEKKSVPGEIINGEVHYLDSVLEMSNNFMRWYDSYINREDSSYIMLAPTNDVWDALYSKYSGYFAYPPSVASRDSLQDLTTKQAIFCARTFNINTDVNGEMKKEEQLRDSMMCTNYSRYDWENYVFYRPFIQDGIFYGKEKKQCSNGYVYIDDKATTIDPKRTFMANHTINGSYSNYWIYGTDDESPEKRNNREELKQYVATVVPVVNTDSIEVDGVKQKFHVTNDMYVMFSGTANNTETTKFSYSLPGVLSKVYYNVYFVFAPAVAENDPYLTDDYNLPVKFRAYLHEMKEHGKMTTGVASANHILDTETGARDLETRPNVLDTLCLLKAHQFKYTPYDDPVAWINFTSYVKNTENQKTYTRRIRINAMILRGFETLEQAEEDYAKYKTARNQN